VSDRETAMVALQGVSGNRSPPALLQERSPSAAETASGELAKPS